MGKRNRQEGRKDIHDEVVQGFVLEHRYLLLGSSEWYQAWIRRLFIGDARSGCRGKETEWYAHLSWHLRSTANFMSLVSQIGHLHCKKAERAYFPCSGR